MSIDQESTGVPEIDPGRRTTKVNLWMIVMVGLFLLAGIIAIIAFSRHHGAS